MKANVNVGKKISKKSIIATAERLEMEVSVTHPDALFNGVGLFIFSLLFCLANKAIISLKNVKPYRET